MGHRVVRMKAPDRRSLSLLARPPREHSQAKGPAPARQGGRALRRTALRPWQPHNRRDRIRARGRPTPAAERGTGW
ncbi:protein of unknown function (plasmid) [Azospirillum baldaniorum]|uniref:Uncharacterized protein n=1 Tax=Azospirillum baldaniorum TaxID=1064539 RepID=A0A9P1JVG2_9PROT|nr:protein of unknown function [Azospirillum baldaniorum]